VGKLSLNAAQLYAKAEGRVFLLVLAYPGCPGTKAVKRFCVCVHCVVIGAAAPPSSSVSAVTRKPRL